MPLPNPEIPNKGIEYFQPYEVAQKLRTIKKPKSRVPGDIDPQIVGKYFDYLAVPLCFISVSYTHLTLPTNREV